MTEPTPDTQSLPGIEVEWSYPPPPTPYDTVRDSLITKGARKSSHFFMRNWLRVYNRLEIAGARNVIENWPCIIAPNHSSHLDTIAVFASLPISYVNRICVLAAKDYFFKNSFVSMGARLMANVIPVDRSGIEMRGLFICLSKLREGKSVLIFPEGTRGTGSAVGIFKEGAIALSRKSGIPIIPVCITGSRESLPKNSLFPRPRKIVVMFGVPVRYWDAPLAPPDNRQAAADLKERVLALKDPESRREG
jgi:1-acyl-sn-glycerol-3-phosphate acyltransferase